MTGKKTAHRHLNIANSGMIWLIPALALYALLCWKLVFVQDDAFISYRYVQNALNGHGLVFNIGERIEGFTNFGWVVILILIGRMGLNIIPASMFLGAMCGGAIIITTWLAARLVLQEKPAWYQYVPVYVLAANGALAYWSPAGLETACFAFLATLSLYFYLSRSWLLIATLLWAVWMRPDGAVIAALLMGIEAIEKRGLPYFSGRCTLAALIFSLPWVAFKLSYYGSLFPNPFYAKTSFDLLQLKHGAQYTAEFLLHYGFLGLSLILPLVFWKLLESRQRAVLLFLVGFMVYVTLIGGDVLKVHRFYLPVFGASATLVSLSMWLLLKKIAGHIQRLVVPAATLGLMAITWFVPQPTVNAYLHMERGFVQVMRLAGERLRMQDQSNFAVATSTIGALGYTLMGHRVVDLVGLCDSTVARHRQTDIAGIESTWKEQSFNDTYVLRQAPEYIVFATGAKPSAPAEQAFFLYDAFLKSYRLSTLLYMPQDKSPVPRPFEVYRKVRQPQEPIRPIFSSQFVSDLKLGYEYASNGQSEDALRCLGLAEKSLGMYFYPEMEYRRAYNLMLLDRNKEAYELMNYILAVDSLVSGPHRDLYLTEAINGDQVKAAIHRRYLQALSPEDARQADSLLPEILKSTRR